MNTILKNTRRPDVTFYKRGRINITARIARMLGMEEGDVIDIAKERDEYMLFIRQKGTNLIGRHDARAHKIYHRRYGTFRVYSGRLTKAIMDAANTGSDTLRLMAGECMEIEGIGKAVPLITRRPLPGLID